MNELRGGAQLLSLKPFTLVCGHYGCGKTNLSLNLAVDLANSGKQVSLVDLDIVNPYFRSGEKAVNVAQEVQTVVKENVQNMTGVPVARVNVIVSGVVFE